MVPQRSSARKEGAAPQGLVALRTARPPPAAFSPVNRAALPSTADVPPRPELRCGRCGGRVDSVPPQGDARCCHCRHHLRVPRTIAVVCASCGQSQAVPWGRSQSGGPAASPDLRRCKVCGRTLVLTRVILPPRHPRPRHHVRPRSRNPRDSAAWIVLVIAVTLIVTVLSVTIL